MNYVIKEIWVTRIYNILNSVFIFVNFFIFRYQNCFNAYTHMNIHIFYLLFNKDNIFFNL